SHTVNSEGSTQVPLTLNAASLHCSREKTNPQEALQLLSSARLSLKSLAAKAKQIYTDVTSGELHPELQSEVAHLEQLITEIQDLSVELRSQSE
ncbi:tetratricopeptide repeat protein 27, partial [Silurus asotus]